MNHTRSQGLLKRPSERGCTRTMLVQPCCVGTMLRSTMFRVCSLRVVFRPANFLRLFSKSLVSAKTRRLHNHLLSRKFRADRVLLDEKAFRPTTTSALDERCSLSKATNVEDATVLEWEDGTRSSFHHIWLRDHCRCSDCYNAETHQKELNLLDIPNVIPKDIQTKEDELVITWPDDHVTRFTASWLRQHTYDDAGNGELKPNSCEGVNLYLWDKEMIESNKPPYLRFGQVLEDELEWLKLCETIIRYGFAFVRETPTQVQVLQQMGEALSGFVRNTHYGNLWEFSNEAMDHADTAYTADYLRAHTDNTYFTDPTGLQMLHCVGHDGTGGMSLLVDGFHAAEKLRQENRQAFQLLTSTVVPFEYISENLHLQAHGPVIELHPFKGNISRIRYNTYDLAPLTVLKYEDIPKFYDALNAYTALTCAPENQYWFKLVPGELLIMANWRVFHGRSSFTGKRIMQGCYISRDDFIGKFRAVSNKSK